MREYLIFQLYGDFSSWGDIAVSDFRPSSLYPSKSAIDGLLAASLGIKRDQEDTLKLLSNSLEHAVKIINPGEFMQDFHTIQVPPRAAIKGNELKSRKEELSLLKKYQHKPREGAKSGTIVSKREYVMCAEYNVAIWENQQSSFPLTQIKQALINPSFVLFLGRKACIPSLPFSPKIVLSETVLEAFNHRDIIDINNFLCSFNPNFNSSRKKRGYSVYFSDQEGAGLQPMQTFIKRDKFYSRSTWTFKERNEHHIWVGEEV
ncbi:type I-E CRISPR-associated protein Cas5/CasD [Thermoproteota archaeon]